MSTLTEIEAAVDALPPQQRDALLKYLSERVRQARVESSSVRRSLVEFSGAVRLHEEPLTWQATVRNEWP